MALTALTRRTTRQYPRYHLGTPLHSHPRTPPDRPSESLRYRVQPYTELCTELLCYGTVRNQPTRARPRPVPRPPRPPLPTRPMGAAAGIAPIACTLCAAFGTAISNVAMALAAVAVPSMAPPSRLASPLMIVWRHVGHSLSCGRHRSQQIAWPQPRRISRGASRQMRHSASG